MSDIGSESARHFRPDLAREFEYLLGQMPRVDRETFQGQLIENAEISDRVVEAEQELFDAYTRGRLPGEWRVAFEERLLGNPEGHAKLALARGLAQQDRPARRRRLWWMFGGLAATVAAVAVGLLFLTRCAILTPCPAPEVETPKVQTFELAAITRGAAERPRFTIDPGVGLVELRVKEPADAFELSLVVAQRTITTSRGGTSLQLNAQLLEPGIYLLTAYRLETPSNYYEFEVVRP